ncbi:MAG: hypothetical protein MUE85_21885 [Microscillaceae bacterium]|jgi:hypothetical protein|nr:hypothetical protein [Microscillaceae bacterium]
MSRKYKFRDNDKRYFVSFATGDYVAKYLIVSLLIDSNSAQTLLRFAEGGQRLSE